MALVGRKNRQEKRSHPRWKIDQFLAIYDDDKATLLGRVEDLSENGMCVLSTATVPIGNHIKLAVETLQEDGSVKTFFLRCRSLWIRTEPEQAFYRIGFLFSGASPSELLKVRQIIEQQRACGAANTRAEQG